MVYINANGPLILSRAASHAINAIHKALIKLHLFYTTTLTLIILHCNHTCVIKQFTKKVIISTYILL